MRIHLLAIDRVRNKQMRALCAEYTKRITRYGKIRVDELSPSNRDSREQRQREESDALRARVANNTVLVVLDERGESLTSSALAERMDHDRLHGRSHWTLVVGGADGHDDTLRVRADLTLSLSRMTMPHELARVVLLEQIYRALSILNNSPYHREG